MNVNIMELDKLTLYKQLVLKRKSCGKCIGLTNPSVIAEGLFDTEHIGPWSGWQGNLNAKILVIGQDWGDENYFLKYNGKDKDANPTNRNLVNLLGSMDIFIKGPSQNNKNDLLFFTNAVLCLKKGGLSGATRTEWFANCCELFLKPLIEIIKPRIVIALGDKVYRNIVLLYKLKKEPFREAVERKEPIKLNEDLMLFPVYHCGVYGVNINRPFNQQIDDWKRIKPFFNTV